MASAEAPPTRRIYTPAEVAVHNGKEDCWIIVHRKVINMTDVLKGDHGILADPILDAAGSDVSHWFDAKTGDVKYHIDPETQLNIPYTPQGRFIHVPPRDPTTAWSIDGDLPWWKDPKLVMGHVTAKVRRIRIVNTLTHQEHVVEVGCEESIEEISSRYLAWNAHAGSYTWKALLDGHFRSMDMACTLEENGVPDDDLEMEGLLLDPDLFLPTLHLYYNDDLTSA